MPLYVELALSVDAGAAVEVDSGDERAALDEQADDGRHAAETVGRQQAIHRVRHAVDALVADGRRQRAHVGRVGRRGKQHAAAPVMRQELRRDVAHQRRGITQTAGDRLHGQRHHLERPVRHEAEPQRHVAPAEPPRSTVRPAATK